MTYENYKIEADGVEIRIFGNVTITEAFDFLSYYEKQGFNAVTSVGHAPAFIISKYKFKSDPDEKSHHPEDFFLIDEVMHLKIKNESLVKKIAELESLIRELMTKPSLNPGTTDENKESV